MEEAPRIRSAVLMTATLANLLSNNHGLRVFCDASDTG